MDKLVFRMCWNSLNRSKYIYLYVNLQFILQQKYSIINE